MQKVLLHPGDGVNKVCASLHVYILEIEVKYEV